MKSADNSPRGPSAGADRKRRGARVRPAAAADPVVVAPREGHFREIFAPRVLPRTLMLVTAWMFQTLGFYGFSAWVPTLLVEHGFKLTESLTWASAIQLIGVPGAFIAGCISDRWQRKYWITLLAIFIATCGMLMGSPSKPSSSSPSAD